MNGINQAFGEAVDQERSVGRALERFDVIIIGAGISGIGAAYHLKQQIPDTSFVILDAQQSFGGTWVTHKYPGIRSDSDLYTFGYRFKPWTSAPIGTGAQILRYLGEVVEDNKIDQHIRYDHEVLTAEWNTEHAIWTISGTCKHTGEPFSLISNFLWMCQGYYRHLEGVIPQWPGLESFEGEMISPQKWPADLDCSGKDVVVIGSGATAATVVPAIAPVCKHVVMLQRSPTYFRPGRNAIDLADSLRELKIDETWIHEIVRSRIVLDVHKLIQRSAGDPDAVKEELLAAVREALGPAALRYMKDFTPSYDPMKQRIAFTPDGDLFQALRSGQASVVTDTIESFAKDGIHLHSGKFLRADIVVAATGFNMNVLGDIDFAINGKPLEFNKTITYRGVMFTGVPNMAWMMGYFRFSWTLRVDLVADFVCRILALKKKKDAGIVQAVLREVDSQMQLSDWGDPKVFNPGYLMRANHLLPKQGSNPEWQNAQDYWVDKATFPSVNFEEERILQFQ